MKLTVLIILVSILTSLGSVHSQNSKLSLNLKKSSLKDVLTEIENQTKFSFLYKADLINHEQLVDVNVTDTSVSDILNQLSEKIGFSYQIMDNSIIVLTASIGQQQKSISGKVIESTGSPLPGVSVVIKGTTLGIVTDINGNYSLPDVPSDAILIFSFVGMKSQEVPVLGKSNINITMEEEAIGIDEIVAVGYGTQKKMNLTGSVVKVDAEELVKQTVTSAAQAIQGRAAGVEVVRNNGAPGAGATIRIRGLGTFGNSTPLVLVDGIEGDINLVSPQDIESVNILKDASACAIYGARAANGVIIITTKAGQAGTSKVNYNYTVGVSNAVRIPGILNAREFALLQNEALINAKMTPYFTDAELAGFGEGYNWIDAVLQTGIRQNHNLQFSGGTEKLRYSLMADLLDETGTVINSWYKRYNVRLNLDTNVTDWLKIGLNSFVSHSKEHETPYEGYEDPLVVFALQYTPTIMPKVGGMEGTGGPSHTAADNAEWWGMDPVTYSNFYAKNRNFYPKYTLTSSFFADIKLMEGLNFRTTWGINKYFANNKVFYPSYTYYDSNGKAGGGSIVNERLPKDRALSISYRDNYSYTITNLLTYTKKLNDVHNINVLIGNNDQKYQNKSFSGTSYNFPTNDLQVIGLGTERQDVGESITHWALRSYFGRLNYDYQGKYLVEFSVRRDASSRFAEKYRWGTFPSGSIGWRISDENFMAGTKNWLDDMKVRGSYGVLGGQDIGQVTWNSSEMVRSGFDLNNQLGSTGLYESYATMNLSSSYPFNHTYTTGAATTSYANPDIKWEVAHMTNIGLDMTLFNGRIVATAEYFSKKTADLILPVKLPGTTGISSAENLGTSNQNVGEMKNTGLEYTIHYFKNIGDFRFDIRYSGTHMSNEILKLQPGVDHYFLDADYASMHKIGEPYAAVTGFNIIGVYQTQDEIDARLATITERGAVEPGDYIYDDTNKDGIIDGDDVIVFGSSLPSYIFGLTANAEYKGFDFNIHIQGDLGKTVNTMTRGRFDFSYYHYLNNYDYLLDRWHGPGTSDTRARVAMGSGINYLSNNNANQNGSYARIRHIELGYNIPKRITQKIKFNNLRLFFNVANLATFTKYEGFEVERTGSHQRTDITPQSRTFSFGVNVNF